jgi:hypothetical protein
MNIGNGFGRIKLQNDKDPQCSISGEVVTLLHQLCVIKFAKTTCKCKWVQVQIKHCGMHVNNVRVASTIV